MNLSNDEKRYLYAKKTYYSGKSPLTDLEFDQLEDRLRNIGSPVVDIIGSYDLSDLKYSHISPMKSLNKIHVLDNENLPMDEIHSWISKTDSKYDFLEVGPKYDGSACNLIYENGILKLGLTRGDGKQGQDITSKVRLFVPNKISNTDKIEIRGEIVIPVSVFNEKYLGDYANPRNFVAGKLGRDEVEECVKDFHFVGFEIRKSGNQYDNSSQLLESYGFETSQTSIIDSINEFPHIYSKLLSYREKESPYQLDGLVIKYPENVRGKIGESSRAPKWSMAIKFPPKETITVIKDINWHMAKGGHYTPIGSVEPVLLDGTTVSNVSLYNYRNVKENRLLPGAKIVLVKSGDIIPKVLKIINPSDGSVPHHIPTHCKSCGSLLHDDGVHLSCINDACPDQMAFKLNIGLQRLGLKHVGEKTVEKIYKAGFNQIEEVFSPRFSKESLISSGIFKAGRQLDLIFEAFEKITEVQLSEVISSFCYNQLGTSISVELAKWMSGTPYDFKGLNSKVVNSVTTPNSEIKIRIDSFVKILQQSGVTIISPKPVTINKDAIKFEMTGSPKDFGFKTKSEFLDLIQSKGYVHSKLNKDCQLLITDSEYSSSSKMKKAKSLGIEILTYDQIIERIS